MPRYVAASAAIMAILETFSPVVEPLSVDEAFVDLTGTSSLHGSGREAVTAIKARIRAETGLTASAGVATNKFVAKVASDLEKPDGLVVVPPGEEARFLASLEVERIWGVGKVTATELHALGIRTIGQLQQMPRDALARRFGAHGSHLADLAFGRDGRPVETSPLQKSVGAETTFSSDVRDGERLETALRSQAERVARELRAAGLAGTCVALKLRLAPFQTLTRRHTGDPTQDGLDIYRRACALLARECLDGRPVRLIGVSVSGLGPAARGQLGLLDAAAVRREKLLHVVDGLAERFGHDIVRPAALLRRPSGDR
jgi:DNA polymerase-4